MKITPLEIKHLKDVANSLPKIPNGFKKVKHAVLGSNLKGKVRDEVKKLIGSQTINPFSTYRWQTAVPIFMNHYDALVRVFKDKGQDGVKDYTIKIKELNISNIHKRANK